jgi:hypothetical protein
MSNGGHRMIDPTPILVASHSSSDHARSALPGAPVIERPAEAQPLRPKRAAATLLRRVAARLDPSY